MSTGAPLNELASKVGAGATPCVTKVYDQKHGSYTDFAPAVKSSTLKCHCGTSLSVRKR